MNSYVFSELAVGMSESFEVTVTDEMMSAFETLSGDANPLHTDEAFAKKKGFGGRVVYGMLAASFYSRLVGMYLPGQNAVLQQLSVKFRGPVFVGDRLTVTGEVSELNDTFNRVVVKAKIENQNKDKVNAATITAGVI